MDGFKLGDHQNFLASMKLSCHLGDVPWMEIGFNLSLLAMSKGWKPVLPLQLSCHMDEEGCYLRYHRSTDGMFSGETLQAIGNLLKAFGACVWKIAFSTLKVLNIYQLT